MIYDIGKSEQLDDFVTRTTVDIGARKGAVWYQTFFAAQDIFDLLSDSDRVRNGLNLKLDKALSSGQIRTEICNMTTGIKITD